MLLMVAVNGNFAYANQPRKSEPQQKEEVVKKAEPKKSNQKLPAKATEVKHKNSSYYQDGSKFYKKEGRGYIETMPPAGINVPKLGAGYKTFKYKNVNYFCLNGIIYKKAGTRGYVVVEPVKGMIVPQLPWIDVTTIRRSGKVMYECDGILYEKKGPNYVVVGRR